MHARRSTYLAGAALLIAGSTSTTLIASGQAVFSSTDLTAAQIIEKSVRVNETDWKAQPAFCHRETDTKTKVDSSGRSTDRQIKTYDVMMIDGSPFNRLISINNEPLSPAQREREKQRVVQEIQKRQNESQSARTARISKYQNDRAEEHLLMQQMARAFVFRLVKTESLNGVECYVLDANPDPNYEPPVEKARVLTGMNGRMWIDKAQYHWVKVHAEVISPVEFGLFLAKVKPGTSFDLTQEPVGNVWLPSKFVQDVNASILGLYGLRSHEVEQYTDYQDNSATLSALLPHAAGN